MTIETPQNESRVTKDMNVGLVDFTWITPPQDYGLEQFGPFTALDFCSYSGKNTGVASSIISCRENINTLLINYEGTFLMSSSETGQRYLVPPHCICFLSGPVRMNVLSSEGARRTDALSWQGTDLPALTKWIQANGPRKKPLILGTILFEQIPHAISNLESAKESTSVAAEPLLMSAMWEVVRGVVLDARAFKLTPIPTSLPPHMLKLIEDIRMNPTEQRRLTDTAQKMGYSVFHFCRTFKQLVGYGFREFTERVRTEAALVEMLDQDTPLDALAKKYSFGSTQALRQAIRRYTGFRPAEIRAA